MFPQNPGDHMSLMRDFATERDVERMTGQRHPHRINLLKQFLSKNRTKAERQSR